MRRQIQLSVLVAALAIGVTACDEMEETLEGEGASLAAEDEGGECRCASPEKMPLHRRPPMRKPPQEAFEACAQSAVGDDCTVTFADREIGGKCFKDRKDESLNVCVPPRPPRHHHRHGPPPEAFEACDGLQEEASCNVEIPARTLEGRCLSGPTDDAPRACVPLDRFGPPGGREER